MTPSLEIGCRVRGITGIVKIFNYIPNVGRDSFKCFFFCFLTMECEISLIQNDNIFTSEHINQNIRNIRGLHNIQVNSKKKQLKR